jgi:DNA polymerase-3 subunit gamma/tau
MAYTVLARRYRSGTFDEVIGQEHIAQTLKKAIASGRIAHAYLFCGTRGTGKTSTARILAKCLNCLKYDAPTGEPCNQCESCLAIARGDDIDVIEIDAASNTGVDNVRDIIENSRYRPSRSRFKVYIIDEVHMLSKSAFNALLKTLEEPPSHVKFILATTEPEKVLPTILSRCQRYDFRNIPTREIAAHLKEICKKEKIKADEDALLLVAKAGAGSMRDSLSLLDRLLSIGESQLTTDLIEQLLGMPKAQLVFDLAQAIGQGDVKAVLQRANAMIQNGLSPDTLIASLVEHLRNLLILRACGEDGELVDVPGMSMKELLAQAGQFEAAALSQDIALLEELRRNLRSSQAGRALLDAALVRLTLAEQFTSVSGLLEQIDGTGSGQKKNTEPRVNPKSFQPPPFQPLSPQQRRGAALLETSQSETSRPGHPDPAAVSVIETATATAVADEDDDDDLPRPGKVWSGPSLAELARQPIKASVPSPVAAPASNVEAVDPSNLPAIWQAMLTLLATKGPALAPLVEGGRFVGVQDGRAVIRYPHGHETMLKMLDRNGKKEQIRDAFTQVLGESVGIAFECDSEAIAEAPATPATVPPPQVSVAATPPPQKQQNMPADSQIRLTAELCASIRDSDPLIRAVIEELGGEIVRVE